MDRRGFLRFLGVAPVAAAGMAFGAAAPTLTVELTPSPLLLQWPEDVEAMIADLEKERRLLAVVKDNTRVFDERLKTLALEFLGPA